jgi:hypothetical protein
MNKECSSKSRGINRYTRKELDELAKINNIKDYKKKNMDILCEELKPFLNKNKSHVPDVKKSSVIQFDVKRPCNSKTRKSDRYTKKELLELCKKLNINHKTSDTIDNLCEFISKKLNKPFSPKKSIVIRKKQTIKDLDNMDFYINLIKNNKIQPLQNNKYGDVKNKQIYIYFISNDNNEGTISLDNKNITYNKIYIKRINKLVDLLNDNDDVKNLIITRTFYNFNDKTYKDQSEEMNEFIINAGYNDKGKTFKNTSIINVTNMTSHVLYENGLFESILNIFPTTRMLSSFSPNFIVYKGVKYNSNGVLKKYIYNDTDINNDLYLTIKDSKISFAYKNYPKIKTKKILNDSSFNFIFKTNIKSQDILDYFIDKKVCSYGKIKQFTGTCWTNSVINSLLLSNDSSLLLKGYYSNWLKTSTEEEKNEIFSMGLEKCAHNNFPLKKFLLIVIYNVLIKNTKANKYDKNFIARVAALLKYEITKNNDYNKIVTLKDAEIYSHKGPMVLALRIIIEELFGKIDKSLQNINNRDSMLQSYSMNKNILLINEPGNKIPKELDMNNKKYILSSSLILVGDNKGWPHVICGFKCDDEYYIYDSNDLLYKHDWTKTPVCSKYYRDTVYTKSSIIHTLYIAKI